MSDDYRKAVKRGKSIIGRMGCSRKKAQSHWSYLGGKAGTATNPGLANGAHTSRGRGNTPKGGITLSMIELNPSLDTGARDSRGAGRTPKGEITPSMIERAGMQSEESRRIAAVRMSVTKLRKGDGAFYFTLREFKKLNAFPTKANNPVKYMWQYGQRISLLTAIEKSEQIDSDDARDHVEYLRARLARLENACDELRRKSQLSMRSMGSRS